MFEIRKRKISVTDLVAAAEEALRMALGIHLEGNIQLGRRDVDPYKPRNGHEEYRYVNIDSDYAQATGSTRGRVYAGIDMMRRDGIWIPDRIIMSFGGELVRSWVSARWEDREGERVVLTAPSANYNPQSPFFHVGDYKGNRWEEKLYPNK